LRFDGADLDRRAWHPVNYTALWVLPECAPAALANSEEPLRAIFAHARQDHADSP
jgi:hypothetical protein